MTESWERTIDEDILARAAEDWVIPGEVYRAVREAIGLTDGAWVRDMSVGVVTRLMLQGFVVAGDVGDEGFVPWGVSVGEAAERIARDWLAFPDPIDTYPGSVFWLCATEQGIAVGEGVWRREGLPPLNRPRPARPMPMTGWIGEEPGSG
ncbi:MAG: hypothetical protein ACQEW8_07190 [Actinomycetota bacterium]